jgi:hypothetical protein
MKSKTPSAPPIPDPKTSKKQPWTPPKLKKLDIEETAFNGIKSFDGDGLS